MYQGYSFGPEHCEKCKSLPNAGLELRVKPYYQEGGHHRVMLIGQDPTIYRHPEKVNSALDLDKEHGQLRRWLRKLFGEEAWDGLTIYATNLVKCSFDKPPSTYQGGALKFLKPYFDNCKGYLLQEIYGFHPDLVLTFGEPAHKLFVGMLDNSSDFGASMQEAFSGKFEKARLSGLEFDYSSCLHIKTFRVAETYGEKVADFREGLKAYLS